jgi:predicted outer membrane repeat protein
LYVDGSAPVALSNITLVNNQAYNGGAIYAGLNGINRSSSEVVMRMHATVMRNNSAGNFGGALYVSGATQLYWGSMLHGHFRQTTMALPTRVEPGEPH